MPLGQPGGYPARSSWGGVPCQVQPGGYPARSGRGDTLPVPAGGGVPRIGTPQPGHEGGYLLDGGGSTLPGLSKVGTPLARSNRGVPCQVQLGGRYPARSSQVGVPCQVQLGGPRIGTPWPGHGGYPARGIQGGYPPARSGWGVPCQVQPGGPRIGTPWPGHGGYPGSSSQGSSQDRYPQPGHEGGGYPARGYPAGLSKVGTPPARSSWGYPARSNWGGRYPARSSQVGVPCQVQLGVLG